MEYKKLTKEEYNDEPVFYCENCLSLNIKIYDSSDPFDSLSYCDDCGGTKINSTNIEKWERMYELKYGKKFINLKK